MNKRTTLVVAWTLGAVVFAAAGVGFVLSLDHPEVSGNIFAIADQLLTGLYTAASGFVGALILARQPRNRIGWLLMAMGLALSLGGGMQEYLARHMSLAPGPDWQAYAYIWLSGWSWWLLIGPLLLILLTFPTGNLLSPRWRWVAQLVGLLFLSFLIFQSAVPVWHMPNTEQSVPNPLVQIPFSFSFDMIMVPWAIALLSTAALCVISVVLRYRRSSIVERQQLKWFFYACGIFLAVYSLGFTNLSDTPDVFAVLFGLAILFIFASIGIAILKYRLFDIDVIIRRTLIYGALTISLALVYFGGVLLFQQALRTVSGQISDLAIVASTLVIAALFAPLRNGIQRVIDRRLYRRKYDAGLVLSNFGATARDEVDLGRLKEELLTVVNETMRPSSVSLWVKKVGRE